MSTTWSREELEAAVEAYFEMWGAVQAGQPIVKKAYYQSLAARFGRTPSAFEFRMQNISYVLTLMGRDWMPGLRPAKNVGANTAASLESIIVERERKPSAPVAGFEVEVRELRSRYQADAPEGVKQPTASAVQVTQYARSPAVKAWVLSAADGKCEACGSPAPFLDTNGFPFLEVHHLKRLADRGSDTPSNAVAVCPNCHRALHYSQDAKDLVERLYSRLSRLRRE